MGFSFLFNSIVFIVTYTFDHIGNVQSTNVNCFLVSYN